MDMKGFLNSISQTEREGAAAASGTTVEYFWQIAGGHRKAGALLAVKIEKATKGMVTKHDLRPNLFGENKNVA